MKLLSGLVISLFLMLSITSCETDQKALLTDGAWTFQNLTTDSEDETIQGIVTLGKLLLTGATLEFQDEGDYLITSPLMEEPTTGTWSLIADQLTMNPEGELVSTGNVEILTSKKLTYTETLTDLELNTYTVTTTWIRE